MKFCNQDISKTFTVRSLKLGQLIVDNERVDYLVKIQKKSIFYVLRVIAYANFDIENSVTDPGPLMLGCLKVGKPKYVRVQRSGIDTIKSTPDPAYQWEGNKLTVRHRKQGPRGQPFPSR